MFGLIIFRWTNMVVRHPVGLVYGLGNGLILTTTNIFITQHFVEYRAVAFGIVYGGSTVGIFTDSSEHCKFLVEGVGSRQLTGIFVHSLPQ